MKKQISSRLRLLVIYVFSLAPTVIHAQSQQQLHIDSLQNILQSLANDTNKVKVLNDISVSYFPMDPSTGILFGEQGLALAQKLHWPKGIATAYHSLGSNYLTENNFPIAVDYYLKCLRIAQQIRSKNELAMSFHSLGIAYNTVHNYPTALEYYEKALKIYEAGAGNKLIIIGCLENIANLYDNKNDCDMALEYFSQALSMAQKLSYKHNIAYISGELAHVFAEQGYFQRALLYQRSALKIFEQLNDTVNLANLAGQIGITYFLKHNYDLAQQYFEKTIKMYAAINGYSATGALGEYYGYLGKIYVFKASSIQHFMSAGQSVDFIRSRYLKEAVRFFKKAIILSLLVSDWDHLQDAFMQIYKVELMKADYPAALLAFKQYSIYKDSATNSEKYRQITRHEIEYEYGKQEDSISYSDELQKAQMQSVLQKEELDKLRLKQRWLYSIIAVAVFCTASFYFLFRNRIQQIHFKNEMAGEKVENQLKEAQYQRKFNDLTFSALRSQMNPHFIFNALNTIQSFVYSNDKKNANNYLGKFSELMRKILDNSGKKNISLKEEIDVLQLYLDIEKVRFGNQLQAIIKVDPALETDAIFIPPMIIQPYAENSIKHGLFHSIGEKKLNISVNASKDKKDVEIVIDDNGIGREKSMEINKKRSDHHSFANAANEERLKLFNQIFENKQRIEIIDKQSAEGLPSGTKIIILIPIILSELV